MDHVELQIIARVNNDRDHLEDDDWGQVISEIILDPELPEELLSGLETFSHVEVLFVMHRRPIDKVIPPLRHPRNNPDWPELGLLAQRSTHHPNPLGLSSVKIIDLSGGVLKVQGLDAVNGSPVLDIKPVFKEFLPGEVKQPPWVSELLVDYWKKS